MLLPTVRVSSGLRFETGPFISYERTSGTRHEGQSYPICYPLGAVGLGGM